MGSALAVCVAAGASGVTGRAGAGAGCEVPAATLAIAAASLSSVPEASSISTAGACPVSGLATGCVGFSAAMTGTAASDASDATAGATTTGTGDAATAGRAGRGRVLTDGCPSGGPSIAIASSSSKSISDCESVFWLVDSVPVVPSGRRRRRPPRRPRRRRALPSPTTLSPAGGAASFCAGDWIVAAAAVATNAGSTTTEVDGSVAGLGGRCSRGGCACACGLALGWRVSVARGSDAGRSCTARSGRGGRGACSCFGRCSCGRLPGCACFCCCCCGFCGMPAVLALARC